MSLLAVFLDLWVNPLHQGVSLHQHVSESRAGEYADNLTSENTFHDKSDPIKTLRTFELSGGKLSRQPAKMLSTVFSSLGAILNPDRYAFVPCRGVYI